MVGILLGGSQTWPDASMDENEPGALVMIEASVPEKL
jgi:hypothetical protein